jgi:hypothetical protein
VKTSYLSFSLLPLFLIGFYFSFSAVRGFLVRRRYKRLRKAVKEHKLEAKTCLQLIHLSGDEIDKQIELLKKKKQLGK